MMTRGHILVCLFAAALVIAGCGAKDGAGKAAPGGVVLELVTEVDNVENRIGDVFHYSVTVRRSENVTIEMPEIGPGLSQFEIRDFQNHEPKKAEHGLQEVTSTYTLSTFTTGDFVIPAFVAKYKAPDGSEKEVRSGEIPIHVRSILPEEAEDIRDIKPPAAVAAGRSPVWVYGLPAVLAVAALGGGGFMLRRWLKRRRGPVFDSGLKLSPHEAAYAELRALTGSDLLKRGRAKEFYVRIAEIIKRYLSRRFRIETLEKTSEEILQEIKDVKFPAEAESRVQEFFADCDRVKFARYEPGDGENEKIIGDAYRLVDGTKEVEKPVEPAGTAGTMETNAVA